MADLESSLWSELAASNIAPSPDGWPSGSSPNIVYTTDREIMGALKRDFNRRNATVTSGGSSNAQTLTYTSNPTALVRGQRYAFIAGFANTGAMTLAVGGLAATAVQFNGAALVGGELKAGVVTEVLYDGSVYEIISPTAVVGTPIPLRGVSDGSSAAAGFVGEYISSVIVSPGATLTSGTAASITSISLTAGDWDVSGEVWYAVGTGGATALHGAVNSVTNTLPAVGLGVSRNTLSTAITASLPDVLSLAPCRVSLASTTPYYLVASATFPSGTTSAYGRIGARRIR